MRFLQSSNLTTVGRPTWFIPSAVTLVSGTTAGCTGPLSTLDPAGPAASSIAQLWWIMLGASVVLLVLVMGLLWLAFAKPRVGTGLSERNFVIAGGLVLPGVTLFPLLVYAFVVGERLLPHGGTPDVLQIRVNAQQFAWTAYYSVDDETRRSDDVVHIPAGRPIYVRLTSSDVIHSFWIPRLAGKIDAIPGHVTVVRLQADVPGVYRGLCAEFCGIGHTTMHFVAHAHSEEDYLAAIRKLPHGEAPPLSGNIRATGHH